MLTMSSYPFLQYPSILHTKLHATARTHIGIQAAATAIKERGHTPLECTKKCIRLFSKIAQSSSSSFRLLQAFLNFGLTSVREFTCNHPSHSRKS